MRQSKSIFYLRIGDWYIGPFNDKEQAYQEALSLPNKSCHILEQNQDSLLHVHAVIRIVKPVEPQPRY